MLEAGVIIESSSGLDSVNHELADLLRVELNNLDTAIVERGRSSSRDGESLVLDSSGSIRGVGGGQSTVALGQDGGRRKCLD